MGPKAGGEVGGRRDIDIMGRADYSTEGLPPSFITANGSRLPLGALGRGYSPNTCKDPDGKKSGGGRGTTHPHVLLGESSLFLYTHSN